MNARQDGSLRRLDSASQQLRSRVRFKNPPPMFELYLDKLRASVARLHELERQRYLLSPERSTEGLTTAYVRMRLRREYMISLTCICSRVLQFAGIEQALKVPHARASHRELVASAEVMLKAVQPYRKRLASSGIRPTFFAEFRESTKELKRIATTSSQRQAEFARVSEQLRAELGNGNEALRILEGLMLARTDHD